MKKTDAAVCRKFGKKERSRIKIMHAAKGLFEEYGMDSVTFQMIADRADMCRTTVFNHFSSIDELMLALTDQEIDDLKEFFNKEGLTGKKLIYAVFDKVLEDTANYPAFAAALTERTILAGPGDNPLKRLERILSEALKEEGSNDPASTVILLEGVYFGLVNHYLINGISFEPEALKAEAHSLLDRLLGGEDNE
ncbi:MAG: TetR/AcrR family transcriptional regulator [Firmicutes bacterium]|nr:TetR/AcrR family transcriptional regulator [Bacillota bacterium]